MANREELYAALRNADAAGDTAAAQRLASYIQSMPADAPAAAPQRGTWSNVAAGAATGIADLGNTVLNVASYLPGKVTDAIRSVVPAEHRMRIPDISQATRTRNADFDAITEQNKDSTAFGLSRIGGNIAATLPVGGVAGQGIKSLAQLPRLARAAPQLERLAAATTSGGMHTGANLGAGATRSARAIDMGTRMAGGAINGGASAGLVNPGDSGTGAAIGAALPPALAGVGKVARYTGNAARSIVQPLTKNGQQSIAARIIQDFGKGGPMQINANEIVPGSVPTLAEATGNAGIAGLQRTTRSLRPNAFVERETSNAAARDSLFEQLAGDEGAMQAAAALRDDAADVLYGKAFSADAMRQDLATASQRARSPFTGLGVSGAREDLATPGLRELASRPLFRQAMEDAKKLAANRGHVLNDPLQSLEGLHYIKLALDDALNPAAKSAMGRNASGAVMQMRDKLADELATVSPLYGNARGTFSRMSQPVNAMEALQGLRMTNAQGNMTLSKANNAIQSLERLRKAPGANNAKSVNDEQFKKLKAIRADLRRQERLAAGKPAGSDTFQNIATDNILGSLLPGGAGVFAQNKAGALVGQAGKLLYSGADEAIRSQLVDMMLTPELARAALARQATLGGPSAVERLLQSQRLQVPLSRVAPVASGDRP